MKKLIIILKERWGISSAWQVVVILIVFTLAGFSTMYSHQLIDYILGINSETDFYIKLVVFLLLILPLWMFFFLIWGIILGQKKFVTRFLKTKLKIISGNRLFKNFK